MFWLREQLRSKDRTSGLVNPVSLIESSQAIRISVRRASSAQIFDPDAQRGSSTYCRSLNS